jgi:hypothetical protein
MALDPRENRYLNTSNHGLHTGSERSLPSQCEELRVICGTRGVPDTVAPFRAWRGSRDLVAQSPKLHALAVTQILRGCNAQSNTQELPWFQVRVAIPPYCFAPRRISKPRSQEASETTALPLARREV